MRPFRLPDYVCALFLALSLITFSNGCSKNRNAGIRVQLGAEPVSLDPALAEDGVSLLILNNLMDGLVGYDGSGRLENHLAESVSVSKDGKRYEFKLRTGILWSDGKPIQARDFVTSFRRSLAPNTLSKLSPMLFVIRNAKAYHDGKLVAEQLGVSERAGVLIIELEKPVPYFLDILTLPVAMPARQDILEANAGSWPETAPVAGAFRIQSHKLDQQIVLEPNPHYWAGKPRTAVTLRLVRDESTAVSLFESGGLEILTKVPALDVERLSRKGLVQSHPFLATYFLSFNTRKPPFNNRDWRRAVAGAIRRNEITATLGSKETPARSWIPVGMEGYIPYEDPSPVFMDSMKKMRRAGGKDTVRVSASFDSGARNSMIMEKVQQDVLGKLGLELSLGHMDWKTYIRSLGTDPAPLFRFGWLAAFKDPISHLEVFTSSNPNNYTGWSSPEYDALVEKIAVKARGPERDLLIRRAQEILVDREAVVIPIYHYTQTHAVAEKVKGFEVNPFGYIPFRLLRLD